MSLNVTIENQHGERFGAYATGQGPRGIVIAQEIFGVSRSMRAVADWFASEGFTAVVPDLFWRQQAGLELDPASESDRETGMQLLKSLDEPAAISDILASADYLTAAHDLKGPVGVVGYCMGGKLAFLSATEGNHPAVSYYGVGITSVLDRASGLKAPVLLHLPEEDALCPPEAQDRIKSELAGNDLVSIQTHAKVGHAFARRASPAFVESAAAVADAQTLEFLRSAIPA
ncbi:carboxymethylenebutenolidase [Altererythrobacter atlanticus]|uniref:Carboxymethylenebutenolidase n=1 Tax=Croceibacterium atlanticum TaxID=1267766 RepID=A0A0F7KUJ0_9SPHN|nr:dienelactone hydrolase family protein [Croceibacterium atlanticum]AKH42907.1 Carboxymethylenebutenolidase [Croceibacterium atlanticum]MBB5731687.1 carboxymethylenebutenolidase [Croceibacterium atlanticum]